MLSILLKLLFTPQPKKHFSPEEIAAYEALLPQIYKGKAITMESTFPKYRFLQYVALKGDFVFHGSNNKHIDIFEPRKQTLFNGKVTEAVFASSEPLWAMFYAVFDRSKLVSNFRNGCLVYKDRKYHYYSLNKATMERNPWTTGTIYIFQKDTFTRSSQGKIQFDEWISHDFIQPVSKLEICAEDFYYKDKVAVHKKNESIIKTMLLYKMRILRSSRSTKHK